MVGKETVTQLMTRDKVINISKNYYGEKIGKGDNADDAIIKAEDVRERADDAAMRVNPVRPDI